MPTPDLGSIVRGSLAEGLEMKLAESRSVEDLRAGRFVVVEGEKNRFFSMITNVSLGAVSPEFVAHPPSREDALRRQVLAGTGTFGTVELRPMLMLGAEGDDLQPVKTVPAHFSPVRDASATDVALVFGSEKSSDHFRVGTPLDMDEVPVCLNLDRFVERSNGIFGKSGTGKTFLTRICLCGLIKQRKAVNLVFDMHSEYGWRGASEQAAAVRGLKQVFQGHVVVYTLDPDSSQRRGVPIEQRVTIPYSQVTVDDIVLLERELNLNPTAVETAYLLVNQFREQWLARFLDMDTAALKDFADQSGAHAGALGALHRKLRVLAEDCGGFLKPSLADADDAVKGILRDLRDGRHVVLEFGQYAKPRQYMLVANILTRRIHHEYVRATEEALADQRQAPTPLVITIEEAHKFLAPGLSDQTIFGTIAREMRKYNVTLLIVDQRPSGIDDEVMSQVGTKLICLLDDEKDVQAVLSGTPNAAGLRGVLAGLESKQQALLLGHAVPMPVVIRTRTYDDEQFRRDMAPADGGGRVSDFRSDREKDFAG